jgi:hypothetical protein
MSQPGLFSDIETRSSASSTTFTRELAEVRCAFHDGFSANNRARAPDIDSMEVRNKMRKRLYRLVLVAVLGGSFALAQNSMPPTQQAPTSDQANTSASALKTQADIQTALAKDYSLATTNVNVQYNEAVRGTALAPT